MERNKHLNNIFKCIMFRHVVKVTLLLLPISFFRKYVAKHKLNKKEKKVD